MSLQDMRCDECGKTKCMRTDNPLTGGCWATPAYSHNSDLGRGGEMCHGECQAIEKDRKEHLANAEPDCRCQICVEHEASIAEARYDQLKETSQ
jgi:hypothetical protein